MKKNLILFVFLLLVAVSEAQERSDKSKQVVNENIYTSIQPADLQPAVFSSQKELDEKIQDKKNKTIALIKANQNDTLKVRVYREQLWRFENAIVSEPGKPLNGKQ